MATMIDEESVELLDGNDSGAMALNAITRAEFDITVATAHRFPRSVKEFVRDATEMATLNDEIAGECMYALKRDGKTIEGPSARFAEIALSAWGNSRAGARIVAEDDRFVTAQAVCHDLQRNVCITYETRRRVTKKDGKKFGDDMVGVTSNAACSIALRNAVLKVIPKAFWKPIYDAARKTAIGDAKTLTTKRTEMLAYFAKLGASLDTIVKFLEVKGVEDISLDHLAVLRGIATAVKDGETTIEQALAPPDGTAGAKASKSDLNDRFSDKPKEPAATPASDSPEPLADLDDRLEQATELLQVNSIEASYCGPESTLAQEQVDIVVRACEARREAIKGTRGGRKQRELA